MKASFFKFNLLFVLVGVISTASAEYMDRPTGIKVGQHMTLRPYVALSLTYDSNVDSQRESTAGSSWVVNPGMGLEYRGENWQVAGSVWYQYHAYNNYSTQLNQSSYGEKLSFSWANSRPDERGWSLMISETFAQISQDDDMSNYSGRGIGRDRMTLQASGILERRINEKVHGAAEAGYYLLDYENDISSYLPLYGWERTMVGGEIGFAPSRWTDFLLTANYQWYTSDDVAGIDSVASQRYSRDSEGWSVMGGIGSRATERISYRLLAGWSCFEYAEGVDDLDGWTYQISGNWKISDTWNTMLLASSYYQPSEREFGSAMRVDSVSWGLAHSLIRGKMTASIDVNYRREECEYSYDSRYAYTDNVLTGRIALNYSINRYLQLFGRVEYQSNMADGENRYRRTWDYDRFRGTIGLRLTY